MNVIIDKSIFQEQVKFSDIGVGDPFIVHGDHDAMLCIKTRDVYLQRDNAKPPASPCNCVELANGYVWHLGPDSLVRLVKIKIVPTYA